jgi:hypothetical protein
MTTETGAFSRKDFRRAKGGNLMKTLMQDVRYGVRILSKSPGFGVIAILTLALGIGANTALFSLVSGVLLNPLAYPEPNQIVTLASRNPRFHESSISYLNFLDWQKQNHAFSSAAVYKPASFNSTGRGDAERLSGTLVSADFFPILGVNPVAGRLFTADDDKLAAPEVILSAGFWQRKFGSSRDVVGKTLTLDGTDCTVIGVLPTNFYFDGWNFRLGDVYAAIGASKNAMLRKREIHPGIFGIGRLKAGVTLSRAQADMDGVA